MCYLPNLTDLTLGSDFNENLDIPSNIKILSLACKNQYIIDSLPNSIEQLNLYHTFDSQLDNLPNTIKKISFNRLTTYRIYPYDKPLNNLPKSLEQLELPYGYRHKIMNKPINCIMHYKESF